MVLFVLPSFSWPGEGSFLGDSDAADVIDDEEDDEDEDEDEDDDDWCVSCSI